MLDLLPFAPEQHWRLGWLLVLSGFLSGAALGAGFHRADFLGGYGSMKRRLLRLGHVAFVALGLLNVLHALAAPAGAGVGAAVASAGFALGAPAMPLVCGVVAFAPRARPLFALPVALLLAAVVALILGPHPFEA